MANLVGDADADGRALRVFPDGRVELLRRVTATFKAPLDVTRFPFDHQALSIELVSRGEPVDRVALDYRQEDLEFSRARAGLALDGWEIGRVSLTRDPIAGWYGETYARLRASLDVGRVAHNPIAAGEGLALGHQRTTGVARFGPDVEHPVGLGRHIQSQFSAARTPRTSSTAISAR